MKRNGNRTAAHGTALLEGQRDSSSRAEEPKPASPGITLGVLAGIDEDGLPLVMVPSLGGPAKVAKHVCAIQPEDAGREVVLSFESGDLRKPVILGLVQPAVVAAAPAADVTLDGQRMILTAKEEIVLRCGKASITLTRAGKVIIRGAYVLSRSSGANRIKGGSVQIN